MQINHPVACRENPIPALPWRTQIHADGVARAERTLRMFVPFPARIRTIHAAGPVRADDSLMEMDEPDIAAQMRGSEAGIRGYEARLAGILADTGGLAQEAAARDRRQRALYPVGVASPVAGEVLAIDTTRTRELDHPMLASRYKGPLMVAAERDSLIPNPALFHVLVQLDEPPPSLWKTRGQLQIDGSWRSLLYDGRTHLAAGVIRESGF